MLMVDTPYFWWYWGMVYGIVVLPAYYSTWDKNLCMFHRIGGTHYMKAPYLMLQSMVSGEDVRLNQSSEFIFVSHLIAIQLSSSCQLESFDCTDVLQPGASCEVRCRFPFIGAPTMAPRLGKGSGPPLRTFSGLKKSGWIRWLTEMGDITWYYELVNGCFHGGYKPTHKHTHTQLGGIL